MGVVEISHVKKTFGDKVLLDDISLSCNSCGLYLIYGASGCGKTTLLHLIAGFIKPDGGSITLPKHCQLAYSFQDSELLPDFTVAETIAMANTLHYGKAEIDKIVSVLGIGDLMKRYPHECSQGQKNRIALARALCMNADVLLVDEPTEALDRQNRRQVKQLLEEAVKTRIVLVVTHDREWIADQQAAVYEMKYQKLTCIKEQKQKRDIEIVQKTSVNCSFLSAIMKRIMNKRMKQTGYLFFLLSLIMILLSALPPILFPNEYRTHILNANMIYIDRAYSPNKVSYQNSKPIYSYDSLKLKNKRYDVRIYPYVDNTDAVILQGKTTLADREIWMNQNTAALFIREKGISEQELLNQSLTVPFIVGGELHNIDMKIVGIVQEDDAGEQMQLYYNKPTLDTYFKTVYPETVIEENANLYMLEADENEVVSVYEALQTAYPKFSFYNSMIYEHDMRVHDHKLFQLLYYAMFTVFFISNLLFYLYYQLKEMNVFLPQFAVVHMCGADTSLIAKCYRKLKRRYQLIVSILMLLLLLTIACFVDFPLYMQLAALIVLFFPFITIPLISLRIQKASFGKALQKDKDQK